MSESEQVEIITKEITEETENLTVCDTPSDEDGKYLVEAENEEVTGAEDVPISEKVPEASDEIDAVSEETKEGIDSQDDNGEIKSTTLDISSE